MKGAFLGLYLLEAETFAVGIKAIQTRAVPLLIFLRILLLQSAYVLRQLFQILFLKLALGWLTRPSLDAILADCELSCWRAVQLQLSPLCVG